MFEQDKEARRYAITINLIHSKKIFKCAGYDDFYACKAPNG